MANPAKLSFQHESSPEMHLLRKHTTHIPCDLGQVLWKAAPKMKGWKLNREQAPEQWGGGQGGNDGMGRRTVELSRRETWATVSTKGDLSHPPVQGAQELGEPSRVILDRDRMKPIPAVPIPGCRLVQSKGMILAQ